MIRDNYEYILKREGDVDLNTELDYIELSLQVQNLILPTIIALLRPWYLPCDSKTKEAK